MQAPSQEQTYQPLVPEPSTSDLVDVINIRKSHSIQETKSRRISRYAGYVLGPLASVVVAPFAYKFGERLAESMGLDEEGAKQIIGGLFASCGTLGISAVASLVCSQEFPTIVSSLTDETLTTIKSKPSLTNKVTINLAIILSILSNIPGAYLIDKVFRDSMGDSVIIIDMASFLVWSTVSGWALYSIPKQAYKALVTRYPSLSYSPIYTDRLKLLAAIESVLSKAEKETDSEIDQREDALYADTGANKEVVNAKWFLNLLSSPTYDELERSAPVPGKDVVGALGIITGFAATYFFIPVGMESGELLAKIIKLEQAKAGFAYIIAPTSFAVEGLMTALSVRSGFINTYESFYKYFKSLRTPYSHGQENLLLTNIAQSNKEDNKSSPTFSSSDQELSLGASSSRDNTNSRKALLLMLFLAFFSSSHRSEMTAQYAPDNGFGDLLIGLSMLGLFCMNYWGFDGLKKQIFSSPLSRNQQTFFGKLNAAKDVVEAMEDRYVKHITAKL